jgi:phospholipase C
MFSRRTILKGMAAGAGLAALGPAARAATAATNNSPLRSPGSLPFPNLPAGTESLPQIKHIVILMMENHSFDSHFGMLGRGEGFPLAADGLPKATCLGTDGKPVRAYHAANLCQSGGGVSQSWNATHIAYNNGANDGFVRGSSSQAMAYYTAQDLPYYYALAQSFPVCDRYFCSVMAQTYPNRRFLMAATALGQVGDPLPGLNDPPPPNGTIFDRLDDHRISWKDYFVDLPTVALFPYQLTKNVGNVVPVADFFIDCALGTLPSVSLVDPQSSMGSEESPQDVTIGAAYASAIINAVLHSPAWKDTMLVFTYDEHGGYYDHVPPPAAMKPDSIPPDIHVPPDQPGAYDRYGFRVPTVIVSPWAKRNYVSHVVHDHTSILKLIETKWNLPAMTYRDANASNLLDSLDLSAPEPAFAAPPALPSPNLQLNNITCYIPQLLKNPRGVLPI